MNTAHFTALDVERDLEITQVIAAPRQRVWDAWTIASNLEQWWIPAPATCRVIDLELFPGGSFRTEMSENGLDYEPHLAGCFLAVDDLERIVFTTSLVAGWRPAEDSFMTAVFTFADHDGGTLYTARALHATSAIRAEHERLGFHDGWQAVIRQLAEFVE